jgi:hypothetical protein
MAEKWPFEKLHVKADKDCRINSTEFNISVWSGDWSKLDKNARFDLGRYGFEFQSDEYDGYLVVRTNDVKEEKAS